MDELCRLRAVQRARERRLQASKRARTDADAPNGLAGQPAALDDFLRDRGYFAVYGARALHCYAREQGSPRDPRVTQTRAHGGWPCY